MKKPLLLLLMLCFTMTMSAQTSLQNLNRAMDLLDNATSKFFYDNYNMCIRYKIDTQQRDGTASVWDYTSALEATNSVMEALTALKDDQPELYAEKFSKYKTLFANLYAGLRYYIGTFELTSYTNNNKQWSVYGVNRGSTPNTAGVAGILNVYDDQQWIIREFIRGYKNTGVRSYLSRAEYLTAYVLDGWDCTLDADGNEYGGITWGPGYTSKHSCSNGPFVSPLVWLSEIYADSEETLTYKTIAADGSRVDQEELKSKAYLDFAKKVYDYQKTHLFDVTSGVYYDMMGGVSGVSYETVNGVQYRKHVDVGNPGGTFYTYNAGTMLSGGYDLYRLTNEERYLTEIQSLATKSYGKFRSKVLVDGEVYYNFPSEGFSPWFNDVLLRGELDVVKTYNTAHYSIDQFQKDLDLAYTKHNSNGILPRDLVNGWDNSEYYVMFQFAYASEYAMLASYEKSKEATGIANVKKKSEQDEKKIVDVYSIGGTNLRSNVVKDVSLDGLSRGIYLVDGAKYAVK